jgi:hypothetical protein
MDATYRFRFLIYLVAFMLFMSLCFVYAEPLPSHSPLLFQVTPQHSGFLSAVPQQPSFDPDALRAASPLVAPAIMQQLQNTSHVRRSLFHRSRRTAAPLFPSRLPMGPWNASSAWHIVEDGPATR